MCEQIFAYGILVSDMAKVKTRTPSEVAIPKLAKAATRAAFNRAVKRGSVMVYGKGELRKVDSKGNFTVVKKMEPRTKVPEGFQINLNEVRVAPRTVKTPVRPKGITPATKTRFKVKS